MQAEQEPLAQLGLCIEAIEEGGGGQNGGQTLCLAQLGPVGDSLNWTALGQVRLDAEEGLAQSWEVQWPDFLKAVQVPQWESPELPKTMRWEVTKSSLVPSEMAADFSPVPEGEAAIPLSAGAPETLHDLDSEERRDAGETNKEMPSEDAASAEVRRQRFRLFRYQAAEGPQAVCNQLHNLCYQWLTPESCTKEQILEQLILEQFLIVLPLEMQSWVRERSPETCYQAVALAEEFLLGQQAAEGWKGQVLATSAEVSASFSTTDEASSELYTTIKEENGSGTNLIGTDELLIEYDMARTALEVNFVNPGELERHVEQSQTENWNESMPGSWEEYSEITLPQLRMRKKNSYTIFRKNFSQKPSLKRHQGIHTGPTVHICTVCGQSFTRRANLFRHQQLHTGQKSHLCTVCGQRFTRRENLVRHLRIHTARNKWMIQNEGELLQVTLEGAEASEKENQDGQKQEVKRQTGNQESKSVVDQEGAYFEFTIPKTGHQGTRKNVCLICGKIFTRRSTLNRHQRMVHTSENLNKCTDCGKSLGQGTAAGKKTHQCVRCAEKNSQNLSLHKHKRAHKGKKRFKCPDCDRGFGCHSHLLRHQRVHTGEKPYICSVCGKSFRQTAHLVKHQRTHKSPKGYFC